MLVGHTICSLGIIKIMGAYCVGKVNYMLPLRFQIMRTSYCVGMMQNVLPL